MSEEIKEDLTKNVLVIDQIVLAGQQVSKLTNDILNDMELSFDDPSNYQQYLLDCSAYKLEMHKFISLFFDFVHKNVGTK